MHNVSVCVSTARVYAFAAVCVISLALIKIIIVAGMCVRNDFI